MVTAKNAVKGRYVGEAHSKAGLAGADNLPSVKAHY